MQVTIPAGAKGWFETKFGGSDVAEFTYETVTDVTPDQGDWVRTVGRVVGFPPGHPPILLHKAYLKEERGVDAGYVLTG